MTIPPVFLSRGLLSDFAQLSLFQNVAARCILEDGVQLAAERWRLDLPPGALAEPGEPVDPPASLVCRGTLAPLFRACGGLIGLVDPVGALAAGWIDDAGDVAARRQHVADVA